MAAPRIHPRAGDFELTPRGLRLGNRHFPCAIGRGGVRADKAEGDGATPRAVLTITGMFYRPDRIDAPASWAKPIGPRDLWSDASGDAAYNSHVLAPYAASHEQMRRADPLYDLVITTDWNADPVVAGKGSAIFIHQWRRPAYPTAGCIALPRPILHGLAPLMAPGRRIVIR